MGSYFSKSPSWDPVTGIPDLTGKFAIVTGASSGIGYCTALQLARHGARVYVATRSEERAHAAIERMYADPKAGLLEAGQVRFLELDLADLDSVKGAAERFCGVEERLDILVNNAAAVPTWDYQTTKQGFEMSMGVNHVGHFLFTVKLLPILKATAAEKGSDVRVVTVSSAGHAILMPNLTFTSPSDFTYAGILAPSSPSPPTPSPATSGLLNQLSRNAASKTANILFASQLQLHLNRQHIPIISTSVHPGSAATEGLAAVKFGPWFGWLWWLIRTLGSKSPEQGAVGTLWLAAAKEVREREEELGGRFVGTGLGVLGVGRVAGDRGRAGDLWGLSERVVGPWMGHGGGLGGTGDVVKGW